MGGRLKIEYVTQTGERKVCEVGPAGLSVGRASTNDLSFADEMLSRKHCLFQPSGETGVKLSDLASANGTFVNGVQAGSTDVELHEGDVVAAGSQEFTVVGSSPVARRARGDVDLGLGAPPSSAVAGAPAREGGSHLRFALWAAAVAAVGLAAVFVVPFSAEDGDAAISQVEEKKDDRISSIEFEKVDADAKGIFRYAMSFDGPTCELSVRYDDIPVNDRQLDKKTVLDEKAVRDLVGICDGSSGFFSLDGEYSGSDPLELNALRSRRIRIVRGRKVKCVEVVNVEEPADFRSLREKLETFSRNELGVWAIQYSREKLLELSRQSAATGAAKYEEREVDYGNLFASAEAYREAVFYLETVNPKPEGYDDILKGLEAATNALDAAYREMRFLANKALNMQDWETASRHLSVLCRIIPDKNDDRNREARAKLVDVEKRLKKGGGK